MVSLRISLRYLFSKKRHNAVNVISVISIAGVAVATAAIVCVLSVFNGFSDLAYSHISLIDPELKITPKKGKTLNNADSLAILIKSVPGVAQAMPTVTEQALAIYGERQQPVTIKGVPDDFNKLVDIENTLIDGKFLLKDSVSLTGCAVMSVGSAIYLGARPGYDALLAVFVPRRQRKISQANPMASFRSDSLFVTGVYEVSQSNYDASMIIVPLETVRKLLDYSSQATAVEVSVNPDCSIDKVRDDILATAGGNYNVADRMMQQENAFRMIKIEKWISFLMLAFILVIASFNVVSTLSMLVIEKKDNMRTLSALGATSRQISSIFLWEGWLISLIGGISGIVSGIVLVLVQQYGGFIKLSADSSQLSVDIYPVRLESADIIAVTILIAITGLAIGFIASRFSRR